MTENEVTTLEEGEVFSEPVAEPETETGSDPVTEPMSEATPEATPATTPETAPEPVQEVIQVIEVTELERPFMTTSFEDYTVTEGLLLLLIIMVFLKWCSKMLKEGFSWLLW